MEKQPNENKYFTTQTKKRVITYLTVVLVALVAFFLLSKIESFSDIFSTISRILAPVIYGVAIAYLINPVMEKIRKPLTRFFTGKMKKTEKAEKLAKSIAIALSIIFVIVLITVLLWMIIPELYNSIVKLVVAAPAQLKELQSWYTNEMDAGAQWTVYVKNLLDSGVESLNKWLNSEDLMSNLNSTFSYLFDGIIGVVSFVINLVVGIIVAVYALIEKDKFVCQSKKLIYAFMNPEKANSVLDTARHGHKIFGGYLSGKIFCCLFVGLITFIFMTVLRMPYPLLISVLVAVTNIIPFLGPFIGAIPSAFLILLIDPIKCLWFIIFVIILQQIEGNIVGPKVVGNTTGISEFWVTFALFLFGGLFGFMGMILGVPLFAVIYYVIRNIVNKKIVDKGLPLDADMYHNIKGVNPETMELTPMPEETPKTRKRPLKKIRTDKKN